jgi:uncharacterized protein (TIGR04255 family)
MDTALSDPHPSYKNPTIVQVTCEIAFGSTNQKRLSAGLLYQLFSSEFPEIQPVGNLAVQLVIGQLPPIPAQDPPQSQDASAFRFATSDGMRFVQISKSNFVYQSNEPYPGWAKFSAKILSLWSAALPHMEPDGVAKVGVRYVNRIVKTKAYATLDKWLQPTVDLPEALIQSQDHFLGRIESSPATSHLRLITLASEPPGPDWPLGSIIMDIDRISTEQFEADTQKISQKLEDLHEDVWATFSAAATDTLKQHLAGTLK